MAFSTKISDVTFSKFVAEVPPHLDRAQLFQLLGGNEALSARNWAGTKTPSIVIGAPGYAAGYCTLSEANGFEAALPAGREPFTHIAVTTLNSGGSGYMGQWVSEGGAVNGVNLMLRSSGNLALAVDNNLRATLAMGDNGFQFIAGSYDRVSTTAALYKGSAGALAKATGPHNSVGSALAKFRVGASLQSVGQMSVAAVMTFNSALTEAEILDIYGYLRRLLPRRGVTVA